MTQKIHICTEPRCQVFSSLLRCSWCLEPGDTSLPALSPPLIISDIVLGGDGGLDSATRPRLARRLSIMAITALSRTSVISWDNFINMPSHHNLATKWK